MPRNVLVVGVVKERCLNLVVEGKLTVFALKERIRIQEGIPTDLYFLVQNGSPVDDSCVLEDAEDYSTTVIRGYPIIRGGKGGFGSLIRAMGMQINKSTNKNACRDLSGRRVRDVKAEKEIAEWIKKEPDRQKEKVEEKRKRREKRMAEPKHYFTDPKYMQQIQSTSEEIQEALKQGLEAATSSKAGKRKNSEPEPEVSSKKTKICRFGVEGLSSGSGEDSEDVMSDSPTSPSQETEEEHQETGGRGASRCEGTTSCDITQASGPSIGGLSVQHECSDVSSSNRGIGDTTKTEENLGTHVEAIITESRNEGRSNTKAHLCLQDGESAVIPAATRELPSSSASKDVFESVCLDKYSTAEELEAIGAEKLKAALQALGLKCGGTVKERAQRLFLTKGKTVDQLDRSLFAKPTKQK